MLDIWSRSGQSERLGNFRVGRCINGEVAQMEKWDIQEYLAKRERAWGNGRDIQIRCFWVSSVPRLCPTAYRFVCILNVIKHMWMSKLEKSFNHFNPCIVVCDCEISHQRRLRQQEKKAFPNATKTLVMSCGLVWGFRTGKYLFYFHSFSTYDKTMVHDRNTMH